MAEPELQSSFAPPQMLEKASLSGINKSKISWDRMLLLAILAGMYIAFGGVFSTVVATGASSIPYGIVKALQGLVFSLGLILVIVGGAELFTGNILMVIPLMQSKIKLRSMLRNWIIVYLGNFLGSLLVAFLITTARLYQNANGMLGQTLLSLAEAKLNYSFLRAFSLGILCNILVCLAVWLCFSARNTADKILSIVFPISAFIAAGFEHSVANMYLVPVAILVKWFDPVFVNGLGINLPNLSWNIFLINNLLPVTLGNIVGGGLFVGVVYALAYRQHS